jgi:hypothetical protein
MTECSTHELAEAVTDPDLQSGWFDGNASREIGDLANLVLGVMNGYVVQAEWLNSLNGPGLPWDAQWLGGGASSAASPAQTISNPLDSDGQHGLGLTRHSGLADAELQLITRRWPCISTSHSMVTWSRSTKRR